jgi:hypothetical protein
MEIDLSASLCRDDPTAQFLIQLLTEHCERTGESFRDFAERRKLDPRHLTVTVTVNGEEIDAVQFISRMFTAVDARKEECGFAILRERCDNLENLVQELTAAHAALLPMKKDEGKENDNE